MSRKNFIYILSVTVGLLTGIAAVTLKNITYTIQSLLEEGIVFSQNQLYFILPVIGLFLVFLFTKYMFSKELEPSIPPFIKRAIPSLLYSLLRQKGLLSYKLIYHPLITAPLTVGFGGSVGLLGPAITSGSALSSNLSRILHVDRKTRTLLIACATAAAVASMFKSPIAAIVLAVEIFSLDLTFASLLPLLIASISSVLTSYFFLGDELLFDFNVTDKFNPRDTAFYMILGLGTGIASIYFTKIYFAIYAFFDRFKTRFTKLLVGGLAIGIMLYFIPPLYGEGLSFTRDLFDGNYLHALGTNPFDKYTDNIWVVILLLIGFTIFKVIAMTTTFAAGGVGGVIVPTMVMGSALGNVIAKILNNVGLGHQVSEANFTLIGMAGLIAGVIHAPLTAIFLIAEITGGYILFLPLMITVAISYMITKTYMEHTIYTRELAERGDLLTHDRDQSVLTMMELDSVIETDFISVHPEMSLGDMVHNAVSKSKRNLFPVVDNAKRLVGIILLDDIRTIMFDQSLYDSTSAETFMHNPPEIINYEKDSMKVVMKKFQDSGAWNLPVIKEGCYYGFVSKSKLLTAYRIELINFTS
ncbi:CIC family chloride channel protein [Winogradskyella epiphytica]|uniref:CIC family chloride channel protein n=2 Tax=Winogradskyella epiphytica TaxID=262005 RepID=A0A2V4XJN2_9FLAO|nr:chloride channel protein [Winogradskyella epiphytica]PYE83530.1 CIC family chloride channel protein [Winogradskyella epiphytica]GGW58829.1 chloride channel protein [Winogradskyella epiphytica]